MKIGDRIQFVYKGGRKVIGIIEQIRNKIVIVKLETDYIGKNDEWFEGELKEFNINEMKKVIYL